MTNFEIVTSEIGKKMDSWKLESALRVKKGNKAAGKRARKLSLELGELMKQWRALSTGREPVE